MCTLPYLYFINKTRETNRYRGYFIKDSYKIYTTVKLILTRPNLIYSAAFLFVGIIIYTSRWLCNLKLQINNSELHIRISHSMLLHLFP